LLISSGSVVTVTKPAAKYRFSYSHHLYFFYNLLYKSRYFQKCAFFYRYVAMYCFTTLYLLVLMLLWTHIWHIVITVLEQRL